MKKNVLLFTMALIFSFALCACNSGEQESTDESYAEDIQSSSSLDTQDSQLSDNDFSAESFSGLQTLATTTDVELSPYLVKAQNITDNLYGYVDIRTGEYVIEPLFSSCDDAFGEDGWAIVKKYTESREKNTVSVINTAGELLFDYDALGNFDAGVMVYGDGNIVVTPSFDDTTPKAYLYHGAQFVRELELPTDKVTIADVYTWSASYSSISASGMSYRPQHYFPLRIKTNKGVNVYRWYDMDGNFVYQTEESGGCLVGDTTGYYYIRDGYVDVITTDGNVSETKEIQSDYYGMVDWDGDNWYVTLDLTGTPMLYTNGLTPLFEIREVGVNKYFTLDVTDGIVRGQDGYLYTLDGSMLLNPSGGWTYGPFQNGYTLAYAWLSGEYRYIDAQGNEVEVTGEYSDYSAVFKGGYFIYGEGTLYGIMNLDGTVVTEANFLHIYDM